MTCPSELTCSRYADRALEREETAALDLHLAGCARCRLSVANFEAERLALRAAARSADAAAAVPPLELYPTAAGLFWWLAGALLAASAVNVAWASVSVSTTLPGWLGWLAPDTIAIGIDLMVAALPYLAAAGGDFVTEAVQTAQWTALIAICLGGMWLLARRGAGPAGSLCLTLCLISMLSVVAPVGHAIEIRRDEIRVTIPADETINDTLVVLSETVLMEGTVTGDLIVIGEQVTVRGRVDGGLLAAAEVLNVEGTVRGSVMSAGETQDFRNASLGANLFGAGSRITLHAATGIAENALLAGKDIELHGQVGRDLVTAAQSLSLFGKVAGSLKAYGETLNLAAPASVGGDLTARLKSADHLQVAPGAAVEGETALSTWPETPSKYLTLEYYLGIALKLVAAFIAGLVLFAVFPALRHTRLSGRAEVLTAAGIGAVVLVATPVLAVAATLTLIGAPIGLSTFMLWLVALYAAGIVTAGAVGRLVLDDEAHGPTRPLIVGLIIVFVLINVPMVGGLVRLVVIALGLGLITQWLRQLWAAREA